MNKTLSADNILNVKVPDALYERILTGIPWFDNILTHEGGMVPSLVYMLTGNPGAGKSTLCRQLGNGLTGNGCIVLYNSGEESKEQVAIAAQKMGIKHGFIYDSLTSHKALIARLDGLRKAHPGKRVILIQDSIQKLTGAGSPARAFDELKDWAKERFLPIIVIFQVTKAGKFKGDNSSLHDADVHLEMIVDKKRNRTLNVSKNRFGPVTDDGIAYTITENGLELRNDPDDVPSSETVELDDRDWLKVGQMVRCNKRSHHRNRGKVAKVTKVGRTRVTLRTLKGEELYLPKDHVDLDLPQELHVAV
jgi:predicted ATP-dependent serine protease